MTQFGTLYLIPSTLGPSAATYSIPADVIQILNKIDLFVVERPKTARAFLKHIGYEKPIAEARMEILDKRSTDDDAMPMIMELINGKNLGILSEAGAPGVADPGSVLVKIAHENNIKVVPLVGPSSFVLALMASGLNGQGFCFHGYLPIQAGDRSKKLRDLESMARNHKQTQIFMETPYRNMAMLESILKTCHPNTKLCIACDLTLPTEYIKTATVKDWKHIKAKLHKRPAVFLLY